MHVTTGANRILRVVYGIYTQRRHISQKNILKKKWISREIEDFVEIRVRKLIIGVIFRSRELRTGFCVALWRHDEGCVAPFSAPKLQAAELRGFFVCVSTATYFFLRVVTVVFFFAGNPEAHFRGPRGARHPGRGESLQDVRARRFLPPLGAHHPGPPLHESVREGNGAAPHNQQARSMPGRRRVLAPFRTAPTFWEN